MSIKETIKQTETCVLSAIRKWWRPLTCIAIFLTMLVHGVIIPLYNIFFTEGPLTDLNGLSLLVTAIAAAFAVREWGKIKGNK